MYVDIRNEEVFPCKKHYVEYYKASHFLSFFGLSETDELQTWHWIKRLNNRLTPLNQEGKPSKSKLTAMTILLLFENLAALVFNMGKVPQHVAFIADGWIHIKIPLVW